MGGVLASNPIRLIERKVGNFHHESRRDWCAYCGVAIKEVKGRGKPSDAKTKDHVIPKAHGGRDVTVPCCHECNRQKGTLSLPEFMTTPYFDSIRSAKRSTALSLRDLWLAMALAAVHQAKRHSNGWPGD